ncbi:helix-turn-helix domain-containing protein [Roseateles sp. DAIF2]|uniref:helix-turn-helix domain-containing protein n=1 Tax=Roseateles sp. DAIF2 TaxID=2714952 RepID=UPI0018A2F127|nr:helix-turn-helix domain-containing protein [Roseateles sp. DAIF2]QPF73026.1 helix-turn-helix domain-containing protein [Roseateles sp. DAIF2]
MESPLPTYSLYGEQAQGGAFGVDWLHCESIAERSRLHHWKIRAHRHPLLFQLFWIERGGCEASIDGRTSAIQGPGLLLLPPAVMHGFVFEPQVEGLVITVQAQHLRKLLSEEPALEQRLMAPGAFALAVGMTEVEQLAQAAHHLRRVFLEADRRWRSLEIDGALLQLLVACARRLPPTDADVLTGTTPQIGTRATEHVRRYRALIERDYRRQPALAHCAERLGITSTQLNRVCQQVLGCSALALLQARLLLEAQRELAYTTLSIKQIAHGLGFCDQAYFTRFYQRQVGISPSTWRNRSAKLE